MTNFNQTKLKEQIKNTLHEMLDEWSAAGEIEDFKERNITLDEVETEATDAILQLVKGAVREELGKIKDRERYGETVEQKDRLIATGVVIRLKELGEDKE